jgi:hypothetical protein
MAAAGNHVVLNRVRKPDGGAGTTRAGVTNGYWLTKYPVFILAALAVVLSGWAGQPAVSFPIGIYGVPSTNDFPALREAGFNLVVGAASQPYLNAAQACGLRVIAYLPGESTPRVRKALDRHPALWAWYLFDEPDLHRVSPAEIVSSLKSLRRSGLRKPTVLTLCQGYEALDYGYIPDILMIDRYPIPWLPLANFGQHVKMARLGISREKPLIAIIQAFDWSAYPGLLTAAEDLRPPTAQELRCMVYEALARGANGIFFYEFDGGWKIREHPEVWGALKTVVREINERLPLFQGQRVWWAKAHEFAEPEQRFNAALESSVTSTLMEVKRGNSNVPAGRYIVAVNNTPEEIVYSFSLPKAAKVPPAKPPRAGTTTMPAIQNSSRVEFGVLGEGRTAKSVLNWIADGFAPYAVHVYGPLP